MSNLPSPKSGMKIGKYGSHTRIKEGNSIWLQEQVSDLTGKGLQIATKTISTELMESLIKQVKFHYHITIYSEYQQRKKYSNWRKKHQSSLRIAETKK
jgi:hypothetical protein